MDYNYSLTTAYDGEPVHHVVRNNDMLDIVKAWDKCVDYGFANEYATYNLSDPLGKMYSKTFYRNGKVEVR